MKLRRIALVALGTLYAPLPYAAEPAAAQHYYYNASCNCSHGGFGGAAMVLGSGYGRPMLLQAPAESLSVGQEGAMLQNDPMQGNIRNTLTSQAQSRAGYINSQQQSTQDWYFQQQALAMAQRRAAQYAKAAARDESSTISNSTASSASTAKSTSTARESSSTSPPSGPATNGTDFIVWPVALKGEYFWSERKMIEDPYLRTPPKLSAPNMDDYRNMAKAVENMKDILDRRMDEGLERHEYDEAKGFLLKLEQESFRPHSDG